MKALLIPNLSKKNVVSSVAKICEKLNALKIQPLINEEYKQELADSDCIFTEFFAGLEVCDVTIAVGGDGTIIHSAKHAAEAVSFGLDSFGAESAETLPLAHANEFFKIVNSS